MAKNNKAKNSFVTVFKRENITPLKAWLIRIVCVLSVFILSMIFAAVVVKDNPFAVIGTLFEGAFTLPGRLIYDAALLLVFGIAIVPAFKMKFWNMGANGQVLIGCLAACLCMFYLKNLPSVLLIIVMLFASLLMSIIWSVVPAIFKAFFNTNETLFTLMMNYIAVALVGYFNFVMAKGKKETPGVINSLTQNGWIYFKNLPVGIRNYLLLIIFAVIATVIIAFYMKKTKHGFEVTVLGDSVNTAKYIGMNTKWVTIRTLFISGIITGIIGFIFASCVHHSVTVNLCGSLGFTGVLVAWLSNFNPIIMAVISFFLAFLTNGTLTITSNYALGANDLSSVIIGLIFFSILVSEFFIRYTVRFNKTKKEETTC